MKRNLESFFRALRSDVAEDVLASEICLWKLFLQTWFYLDEISVKKNAGWMEDGWKVGPRATGAWEFRFPRSRTWFNFSETGRRFIYSTNDVEISIGLGCPPESIDGTSVESIDFRTPRQGHPASLHVFTDLNPDHPPPPSKIAPLMSKNWRKARQRVILKYSRLGQRESSWRIERWCLPSGGDDARIRLYCLESIHSCTRAIHSNCLACFGIFSTRACEKKNHF